MSYHKPPDLPWAPNEVAQYLCDLGVDARNVDDCVEFNVTVAADRSWIGAIVDQLLPGMTGVFTIEILHRPDKFIRNLVISRHVKMPFDTYEKIHKALTSQGYVYLTGEIERTIARKYCRDLNAIETMEAEISLHQKEKEELVNSQDFEAAARARDLEYDGRNRLESLVMNAAKHNS